MDTATKVAEAVEDINTLTRTISELNHKIAQAVKRKDELEGIKADYLLNAAMGKQTPGVNLGQLNKELLTLTGEIQDSVMARDARAEKREQLQEAKLDALYHDRLQAYPKLAEKENSLIARCKELREQLLLAAMELNDTHVERERARSVIGAYAVSHEIKLDSLHLKEPQRFQWGSGASLLITPKMLETASRHNPHWLIGLGFQDLAKPGPMDDSGLATPHGKPKAEGFSPIGRLSISVREE